MEDTMRLRILTDIAQTKNALSSVQKTAEGTAEGVKSSFGGIGKSGTEALSEVERAAALTGQKMKHSFGEVGSFIKKTIGITAVGVGVEQAVESASKIINLQKVQAKLIENNKQQNQYALSGAQEETRWYSKKLDNMATELSLQNGINKTLVVQAQTYALGNQDVMKMTNSMKDGMKTYLSSAANIAEITGGSITGTSRMLSRMLADPAKSMSSMKRMGFQLSKDEQNRVKQLEKTKGLLAAQQLTLELIDKHTHGIAAAAQSPVDLLKNQFSLLYQSFGIGLIPIFESLAKVLGKAIQPMLPILEFMGKTIGTVADSIGESLGIAFSALTPVLSLLTTAIIPSLLKVLDPLLKMAAVVIEPLTKAFAKIVGTEGKLGPLAKVFVDMGNSISGNLMVGVNAVSKAFDKMSKDGTLDKMFNSLVVAMRQMAPILPSLALAMSDLVIALLPIIVEFGPALAQAFVWWTLALSKAITFIVDKLTWVINWVGQQINKFGKNKLGGSSLTKWGALLAAAWFGRKVWTAPIKIVMALVEKFIGKATGIKNAFKGFNIAKSLSGGLLKLVAPKWAARREAEGGLLGGGKTPEVAAMEENTYWTMMNTKALEGFGKFGGGGSGYGGSGYGGGGGSGYPSGGGSGYGGGGRSLNRPMTELEKTYAALHAQQYGGSSAQGTVPGLQSLQNALSESGYAEDFGKQGARSQRGGFGSRIGAFFRRNGTGKNGRFSRVGGGFGKLFGSAKGLFGKLRGGSKIAKLAGGASSILGFADEMGMLGGMSGISSFLPTGGGAAAGAVEGEAAKVAEKSLAKGVGRTLLSKGGSLLRFADSAGLLGDFSGLTDLLPSGGGKAAGKEAGKVGRSAAKKTAKSLEKSAAKKLGGSLKKKAASLLEKGGKKFGGKALAKIAEKVGIGVAERGAEVAAAEGIAAALGPETLGISEVVVNGALAAQTVWEHRKTLMKWGKTGLKFAKKWGGKALQWGGKALGKAAQFGKKAISGVANLGKKALGGALKVGSSLVHGVGSFFGGLFGGGGDDKEHQKKHEGLLGKIGSGIGGFLGGGGIFGGLFGGGGKSVDGGAAGKLAGMNKRAAGGEMAGALTAIHDRRSATMNTVNVHPNAVIIQIHGNPDAQTTAEIQKAVHQAFTSFLQKATVHK